MSNELSKIPEIKSLTDIVRHSRELPTIRNANQEEVNKAILELLVEVFSFYNESLNDVQLKLTLPTVKEALQGLTVADIYIFKKNCLQGEYPLKFRLTPNVLIEWIKQYKSERMDMFESFNLTAKKQIESEPISEKTVELLKDLEKKVSEKMGEKYTISSIAPTPDKYSIQAKELQKWIENEFYKLLEENLDEFDLEGNGPKIPFLIIGGKKLIKSEYVKLRYEEIHKKLIDHYYNKLDHEEMQQSGHYISPTDYIYEQIEKLINGKNAT